MNTLHSLIEEIKKLEKELILEAQKKEKEFFYKIEGKKILFEAETKKCHKKLAAKVHTYIINAPLLHILTAPIIWSLIIPTLFMDLAVSIYQFICFRVYGIPKVKRSDYIVMDRQSLAYLNPIEKLNCIYCGYFNGLIAYVGEIAARTEQFWCPIKHARKLAAIHSRYHIFLDYGDCKAYKDRLKEIRKDFNDIRDGK